MTTIAQLTGVSIGFPGPQGAINIVIDSLSLTILAGERVGLIGASGSGKSLTALSVLGLVPSPGEIVGGSVEIQGKRIFPEPDSDTDGLRGGSVGIIFQEAESALNPVMTIGAHLREVIKTHRPSEEAEWKKIASDLLGKVDLDPARIIKSHPHRLSGGQRQRALLAIALAGDPNLIIADEPTSSLDVLTQARILGLLDRLCREENLALLLISHDLGVVSSLVERVIVILAGAIVEEAPIGEFLNTPLHPYSQSLVASARQVSPSTKPIKSPPTASQGCAFAAHCPRCISECEQRLPDLVPIDSRRSLRCPVVLAEANR